VSRRQTNKFNEGQQKDAAAQQSAYEQGVLTDAEFAAQKAKLLG